MMMRRPIQCDDNNDNDVDDDDDDDDDNDDDDDTRSDWGRRRSLNYFLKFRLLLKA